MNFEEIGHQAGPSEPRREPILAPGASAPGSALAPGASQGAAFDALLAPGRPPEPSGTTVGASRSASVRRDSEAPSTRAQPVASAVHEHTQAPSVVEFVAHWDLYRDPVIAGAFAGAVLGVAGVFIVLRRAVFVTAAVSQSAALGVACAFLIGIHTGLELPPVLLAFAFAGVGALALAAHRASRLPQEAVVGFVYLATGALALIVGDKISQEAHDITALLFGSAVLVRPLDLALVVVIGTLALGTLVALARGLAFAGFEPEAARVQGLPVRSLETTLWLVVAAEVAVTTRALGALPVFAFAVLPAFAALGLGRRLPHCLALAGVFGALSGAFGYLAAYLVELPVGASQTVVAVLIAIAATLARR